MTRWQPDTCDGYAQGLGCIIDIIDWGLDGVTPNGLHVQQCKKHTSLKAAHAENLAVSKAKNPTV